MRLRPFAALFAAGLSLIACVFDGSGLSGNTPVSDTNDDTTGDESSTDPPTSSSSDPTGGAICGNFDVEDGEECDNGESNNGNGAVCRDDCILNVCGDAYVATFTEGCDDGNKVDGDGCSSNCELEGCGDGMTKGMEECDDGNSVDDDNCTNLCRLPQCGDGIQNGNEECDDPAGNTETGACVPGCKTAVCGDGFVQEGVEACDDMNTVDDDGCSNMCVSASCGDGMVQAGETCDDGNTVNEDACLNTCAAAACGDGVEQMGVDQCDDGNTTPGDGCSAMCTVEMCGNGIMDPGEACDDGNDVDTDACLKTCVAAQCGDGVEQMGVEECDDMNMNDDDDCTNACKDAKCGDSIVKAGPEEECDDGMATTTCSNQCKRAAYWVFVSSAKLTGDEVGDPDTADAFCTALSMGTMVEGKYKAFLGDSMTSAASRLFHSPVKYIVPSKGTVANSWADLIDGNNLGQPISRDENNLSVVPPNPPMNCQSGNATDAAVWTGSKTDGTNNGIMDCDGWGDPAMMGSGGLLNKISSEWSNCTFSCGTEARIYCFEQPAK
jgi:cysteine-rich repeat protein